MNWNKCMKSFNCKVCSDYNYCKDDIKENNKKEKRKKKNESKGNKELSRQNNK